ncbi:MHYT domain-containing protein, partial [Rhizobiaceae sp. 2RAB30]
MFRVVSCLAYEHDYSFVLVALIVCIAGSAMTVQLYQRARHLSGNERARWIVLSGAAGGMAIWTTHFVSMAGFNPPLAYAYEPILTLGSLVLAVGFTMAGLTVATACGTAWAPEVGGLIVGIGIASMHFTGMAGLSVAGRVEWDADLVAASILLGLAFAVIAINRITRGSTVLGIAALVFAIASMHFTAMGAAVFFPDPSVTLSSGAFSSEAIAISVVALLSVLTGLVLYVVDARSQREMMSSLR